MKEYVLGFAMTEGLEDVLLITKNRPDWQKGLLNGIGGKVEMFDVCLEDAMIREFREECGIETDRSDWKRFGKMIRSGDFVVYCFYTVLPCYIIDSSESITDEVVMKYDINEIKAGLYVTTENLPMLLSMATCPDVMNGRILPIDIIY